METSEGEDSIPPKIEDSDSMPEFEKAYFMSVVAHEQAIAEFARAELDGVSSSSLVPVMNLLQRR